MDEIQELQQKRDNLRDELSTVFSEAKTSGEDGSGGYNFRNVKSLDVGDKEGYEKSVRVAELVRQKNSELDEVCKQIETLEAAEGAAKDFSRRDNEPRNHPGHPGGEQRKSLGKQIVEHPTYKSWLQGEQKNGVVEIPEFSMKELKTLFQTSAGWSPESVRSGIVVEDATRPIQVTDIIPMGDTGQQSVVYMEETTRTHNAAETSEANAYPESAFALTEKSTTVRKIADSIPVTDEQLEDVAMVESYLDGRLRFGIRQRLDGQILTGNGTPPNLEGINNVTGVQTQAKSTDPVPDAVFKAFTKLRVTGRVIPTHVIMHPNDWQGIRLLRTSDGVYIWGNPSESGPERLWGVPVVQSDAQTENTALAGSFQSAWIMLFERRGIVVERGYVGSQFTEGKETLRASMRGALAVFRPEAFCQVTGI